MINLLIQSAEIMLSERVVQESLYWINYFIKSSEINDRDINSEEYNPAFMHYSGPAKKFCKDMNKNYISICEAMESGREFIGETYREPTELSNGVSKFLGFGANVLAGYGILGASCQIAIDNMAEPLLRKAQFYLCEEPSSKFLPIDFHLDDDILIFEEDNDSNNKVDEEADIDGMSISDEFEEECSSMSLSDDSEEELTRNKLGM